MYHSAGNLQPPVPPSPDSQFIATPPDQGLDEKWTSVCPANIASGLIPGALAGFVFSKKGERWKRVGIGAGAGVAISRVSGECDPFSGSGFDGLGVIALTAILSLAAVGKVAYIVTVEATD